MVGWVSDVRQVMDAIPAVLMVAASVGLLWRVVARPNIESTTRTIMKDELGGLHQKLDETAAAVDATALAVAAVQKKASEAVKQLTENGHRNRPGTAKDDLAEIKATLMSVVARQDEQAVKQDEQARKQDEQARKQDEHLAWSEAMVQRLDDQIQGKADRDS